MKRVLLIWAAALLMALPAAAKVRVEQNAGSRVTPSSTIITEQRTSAMNFSRIEVSGIIRLTVEERTDNIIEIRANENVMPYVKLSVSDGVFSARIQDNVRFVKDPVVEVSIPNNGKVSAVRLSGASKLNIEPHLSAQDFKARVSGASRLNFDLTASSCKIDVSGASNVRFGFEGGTLEVSTSGASSTKGHVSALKSDIEVSGSSSVHLDGSSASAGIEVSGVSNFRGFDFATEVCTVEASGVSSIEVNCTESLSARSSGTSKITYNGDCRLSSASTSGMSSIKKK